MINLCYNGLKNYNKCFFVFAVVSLSVSSSYSCAYLKSISQGGLNRITYKHSNAFFKKNCINSLNYEVLLDR